jgi:hypothetical protein
LLELEVEKTGMVEIQNGSGAYSLTIDNPQVAEAKVITTPGQTTSKSILITGKDVGTANVSLTDLLTDETTTIMIKVTGDNKMNQENPRNWNQTMRLPTREEIDNYNLTSTSRSPYLCAWLDTDTGGNFTQFSVDFKADYLPSATYCSLANFQMDYSTLREKYKKVYTDYQISGYAGFQRNIDPTRYNSILSLWSVYCEYGNGEKDTIRAKLIKPEGAHESSFGHEGAGVNYLPNFPWKAKKWYRMLLRCDKSTSSGNTTIEQWVCDLSNKKWTQICVFDMGAPDLSFKGKTAVFLENFQNATSGEIRTLEFKNARVCTKEAKQWVNINSAYLNENKNYPGSYEYGTDGATFWMITSGVPDCAGNPAPMRLNVENPESGRPY